MYFSKIADWIVVISFTVITLLFTGIWGILVFMLIASIWTD